MEIPGLRLSAHLGLKEFYSVFTQKVMISDQRLPPINDLDRLNRAVVDATHAIDAD
jgi:hypothetical protein